MAKLTPASEANLDPNLFFWTDRNNSQFGGFEGIDYVQKVIWSSPVSVDLSVMWVAPGWRLIEAPVPGPRKFITHGQQQALHNQWKAGKTPIPEMATTAPATNALPAGSPAWATTLWNGIQSLSTGQDVLGQGVNTAANNAQAAATAAAANKTSAPISSQTWLIVAAIAAAFFFFKK